MVRVGTTPAVARAAWYDRTAASKCDYYYGQGVSPHAVTTRLTYTVPAGKKAMVEVMQVRVRRASAATTVGLAGAYVMLTPSGGVIKEILDTGINDNTVNARDNNALGGTMVLCTGDQLDLKTYDLSTGGTCDYFVCYKLTEFDA